MSRLDVLLDVIADFDDDQDLDHRARERVAITALGALNRELQAARDRAASQQLTLEAGIAE
jgi:hypothetical protein